MDLWFLQAARVMAGKRRRVSATSTLDEVVRAVADGESAADGLDPSLRFTLQLARGLLSYGMPAFRVEDALERLAEALGFDLDAFCTPTALIITLQNDVEARTRVIRVNPGGTDLARLSAIYELVGRVERKELTPGDAAKRLDTILARPSQLGRRGRSFSYALVSASAAVLLGGGGYDIPFAAVLGLLVGFLEAGAQKSDSLARLLPSLAALVVSFAGTAIAVQGFAVRPSVLLLAPIMVLLPGLTLTTAMVELATAHLVSGTSRLMGAIVTFLQLGFGLAFGRHLAELMPSVSRITESPQLPWWVQLAAPFAAAIGFSSLLKARAQDRIWVLFATAVALGGSRLGGWILGAELGAFVAALLVATAAHVFSRFFDRPLAIILTPGILSLVPGSIGFLSVNSLLDGDVVVAVATAFRMLLVAMALAAGILVATAAVPPRRSL